MSTRPFSLMLVLLAACTSRGPLRVSLDPSATTDQPHALLSLTPGTRLVSLDGQSFRYRRFLDVEVPPGEHVAVLHYINNKQVGVGLRLVSIDPVTVTWTAEAGRTYQLQAEYEVPPDTSDASQFPWSGAILDVTDPETQPVLAEAEGIGLLGVTSGRWPLLW